MCFSTIHSIILSIYMGRIIYDSIIYSLSVSLTVYVSAYHRK